jgi:tripartite-type tricarboxylate transporter receptor subunit TctC
MNSSALSRRIALARPARHARGAASAQNWKPTRPINLIVPWARRLD